MIVDQKQFDKFLEILPELERDEVYFISLSARAKYLSQEERDKYSLGRTEMFSREIAYDKEHLMYVMKKLESSLMYRRTNNGSEIPRKALVTYININPSSSIKAYNMFTSEMNRQFAEIYQSIVNDKETNYFQFRHMQRKLMNCIQKNRSRKIFIDIDFDCPNEVEVWEFVSHLKEWEIEHYIVKTQGGFHILIKKDSLHKAKGFKLHTIVNNFNDDLLDGEVIFNKNEMIPVIGTLQAGKLVKLIEV